MIICDLKSWHDIMNCHGNFPLWRDFTLMGIPVTSVKVRTKPDEYNCSHSQAKIFHDNCSHAHQQRVKDYRAKKIVQFFQWLYMGGRMCPQYLESINNPIYFTFLPFPFIFGNIYFFIFYYMYYWC